MSITDASTKILEIPALERDFREGSLYDARNEKIVPGYSLWDAADLEKIKIRRNDSTVYSINASDTLSEKFMGLDTSASVQLSILSGLIELGGSVAYLTKEKNTRGESSIQIICFYKTGYREMDMDQLTNIRYPDVARTGNYNTATHFVMRIQYGAGAIFTFTKRFQSRLEEEEVKAKAELNICGINVQSVLDGSFERNYRNFSNSDKFKCEFKSFGLSLSEALPTTYDEAIKFASNFGRMAYRSMARHGGEALGVPCTVWLHPLVSLPGCGNAPRLHWTDFTHDQACKWIKFFEDCNYIEEIIEERLLAFRIRKASGGITSALHSRYWKELENEILDEISRTKKFLPLLRSDSKTKLKEMIINVRSGHKSIEYFNQWTSSIAECLCAKERFNDGINSESSWRDLNFDIFLILYI